MSSTEKKKNDKYGKQLISKLQIEEITPTDLENLQEAGYCTIESIAFASKKDLLTINGISEAKADKMMNKAMEFVPIATKFHMSRSKINYLTTGSKELDAFLGGGLKTGSITEIFGESGTGKTQLCHTFAVTCQLPVSQGGGEGKCIYIDSESTFKAERLFPIAERYKLNIEEVLNNVAYARINSSDDQTVTIAQAAALMLEIKCALLIVDLIALYRIDYSGSDRSEPLDRRMHLAEVLRKLLRLADVFEIAVIISNQMAPQVDIIPGMIGDSENPIGGNILANAATTRLYLRKGKEDTRICKIYKSPCLPESEAIISINADGIGMQKDKFG